MPRHEGTRWGVAFGALLLVVAGCSEVPTALRTKVEDPAPSADLVADVQEMLPVEMSGWWRAAHRGVPGAALSTAADAHTSSWRNWGMLAVSSEPRQADLFALDEEYGLLSTPWAELNRTLTSARDIMAAVVGGAELGSNGSETRRAVVFSKFVQGLALGTLAELFHQAFILDESVDVGSVRLSSYPEVMQAALAKLQQAADLSEGQSFTIPAAWVGFDRDLDRDGFVRLVRSERARLAIAVARTPAERQAVDWTTVLADVRNGIAQDWGVRYDGDYEHNWASSLDKLYPIEPHWGRLDYRMIGPADASGAYQAWIAAAPADRRPFLIDTDDRRITAGEPAADGTLVAYEGNPIFRPNRGYDHFSFYGDRRWLGLVDTGTEGFAPDFPVEELAFIEAEAHYRMGDRQTAMAMVNVTRTAAGLPAFTDPTGIAPGGARCVPKRDDGTCGDLWDALAYEKRIEIFHYGPFTEFTDDRGWGDLVTGTFLDLPAPAATIQPVLGTILGVSSQTAAKLANDVTASGLHSKLAAYRVFDQKHNSDPGDAAGG